MATSREIAELRQELKDMAAGVTRLRATGEDREADALLTVAEVCKEQALRLSEGSRIGCDLAYWAISLEARGGSYSQAA